MFSSDGTLISASAAPHCGATLRAFSTELCNVEGRRLSFAARSMEQYNAVCRFMPGLGYSYMEPCGVQKQVSVGSAPTKDPGLCGANSNSVIFAGSSSCILDTGLHVLLKGGN